MQYNINYDKYVGIPFEDRGHTFDGADCYGLLVLFYKVEFNIDLFIPTTSAFDSRRTLSQYLKEISHNWISVDSLKVYDGIAMAHDPKHPKIIQHFGIYLGDNKMLHTLEGIGSHIVDMKNYEYFIRAYHRRIELVNN